ncbi:MAG TPA: N-acetylmuramoyl-L-alanine amidase-like domain-containing protein [Longimicrobiales bacterium]|nr:N-acetylmuramoyl-L-alanine amidase-like domain-containing protein [Longimicrobiales bacterium]
MQDSIPGTAWTREDWEIFRATLEAAQARGLDTLPLSDAIAEMGALFLGTPYVPQTLEVPGPERLVVNLRGLDCVTFVENVLALTRFHRVHGVALLQDPEAARGRYEEDLAALRYREGRPDGYASRLHYFSEWLTIGEAAGRLEIITAGLGGVPDPEPVTFMTAHREAYRQLADPAALGTMAGVEARLAASGPRTYLPQTAIADAAAEIRNGDIIAATSTLEGLDVAHTGFAYWVDGALHLLHAPLVGSTVVLSERPLAERILATGSQDGIMVARPRAAWFTEGH